MMKVLLINVDWKSDDNILFIPNLGLLYLASYLKDNDIETDILDLNISVFNHKENPFKKLLKVTQNYKPNLIGFNCLFSGNFAHTLEYAKFIKYHRPNIKIVFGGQHPTMFHKEIIKHCDYIDYVIRGEGEIPLFRLAQNYLKILSIEKVPQLTYRQNGTVQINNLTEVVEDINNLPRLCYELINFQDYYHQQATKNWWNPRRLDFKSTCPIITSRGCPYSCNFCSMFLYTGRKWRPQSPRQVVDNIEYLYNTFNHRHFSFMDDNLTLDKKRIIEICNEIVCRNLNIAWETPNGISMKNMDEEILGAMINAGMVRTTLAIESGSEFIRNKVIGKNLKTEDIYKVIDLTKKYSQLFVQAFFILGFPEDTQETLEDTYNMIDKINIDYPRVNNAVPFFGTKLFSQCAKDDIFTQKINANDLWKTESSLDKRKGSAFNFFIKPYKMTLASLVEFRKKIDILITRKMDERINERKKNLEFIPRDYSPIWRDQIK